MTKPSTHGISAAFFVYPAMLAIFRMGGGKEGVEFSNTQIVTEVLKELGITKGQYGKQKNTNRELEDVWMAQTLSKLHADGYLTKSQNGSHSLTKEGLNYIIQSSAEVSPVVPDEVQVPENKAEVNAENTLVNLAGLHFAVHTGVPDEDCLPMPAFYRVPTVGELGKQIREAAIALKSCRSTYIWGLPGAGKDAFFHAYSFLTKTPALIFQIKPGADIQGWFFTRSMDKDGTGWEEGSFLRAVRDGYTKADGTKIPYLLLVSDFDRSTKSQAEYLRLIMDSISGRVEGPGGKAYSVFPGTLIMATANTSGSGDVRGRCVSSNVLDASILDRFERKIKFDALQWVDEEFVVKEKFPYLLQVIPSITRPLNDITRVYRASVEKGELYAEFSHRALCSVMGHVEDVLKIEKAATTSITDTKQIGELLRRGLQVWLDGLPDDEVREAARKLADPFIPQGAMPGVEKKETKKVPEVP